MKESLPNQSRPKKQFRYENVWQTHVDYDNVVKHTWLSQPREPGLQGVAHSLQLLQRTLEQWSVREFGCIRRTVRQLQKKLDKLRSLSVERGPSEEEKCTAKNCERLCSKKRCGCGSAPVCHGCGRVTATLSIPTHRQHNGDGLIRFQA